MITAILEITPRNQKVAVSKFRKHEHSKNQIFRPDDLVRLDKKYYEERDQEAADKAAAQIEKKDATALKKENQEAMKQLRQNQKDLKKRLKEYETEEKANRQRQSTCRFCQRVWKGAGGCLWCDNCDDVCILAIISYMSSDGPNLRTKPSLRLE